MCPMPTICNRQRCYKPTRQLFLLTRACCGFSLIELLIVITCISAFATAGFSALNKLFFNRNLTQAAYKLELAFALAHSIAVSNKCSVTLKPSCGSDWRHGISVLSSNHLANRDIKIPPLKNTVILLQQSGVNGQKVEIQANGYCKSNGHFSIIPYKSHKNSPIHLYFNKAARIYIKR